jgi:hypothetical protein
VQSILREEGEIVVKVLSNAKEKISIGAAKSIDYIGKLLDETEARMKASRWGSMIDLTRPSSLSSETIVPIKSNEQGFSDGCHGDLSSGSDESEEETFQVQLAMAISLSEMASLTSHTDDVPDSIGSTGEGSAKGCSIGKYEHEKDVGSSADDFVSNRIKKDDPNALSSSIGEENLHGDTPDHVESSEKTLGKNVKEGTKA